MSEERERRRRQLAIMARLRDEDARAAEAAAASTQPQNMREPFQVKERFPGNAFLMVEPDGTESLVTPSFATSDPREIQRILRPIRRAEEIRARIQQREERRELMRRPGEDVTSRAYQEILATQQFVDETEERKALEQERIFERIAGGNVEQVLGRRLSQDRPVSMLAMQVLRGTIGIGPGIMEGKPGLEGVPFIGEFLSRGLMGEESEAAQQLGVSPREIMLEAESAFRQQAPIASTVAQTGGTLASAALVPGLTRVLTPRGPTQGAQVTSGMVRGSGVGATEGAIAGAAGAQEGQELTGAAIGGMTGGLLGAVAGSLTPVLAGAMVNGRNYIMGVDDARLARELGVTPETAQVVRQAMASDDFNAAAAALRAAGANSMLADASPIMRDFLDAALQLGGAQARRQGRELIEARASQASRDFQNVLDNTLGVPEGRRATTSRIRLASADQRRDAYDTAYSLPIDYSTESGRRLEELLDRVAGFAPGAISAANRLLIAERGRTGSPQILADVAADGSVTFRELPDVRQIDYIRRALGDIAESGEGRGAMGAQTQIGATAARLRRELRDLVAESVPEYRQALNVASDTIDQINMADLGYRALSPTVRRDEIIEGMQGATGPDRVAAQIGLRNAIDDQLSMIGQIASDPNREARELSRNMNLLTNPAFRQKVATIMGNQQAANRLMARLDEELTGIVLRAAVNPNSGTARRGEIQRLVRAANEPNVVEYLLQLDPLRASRALREGITGTTEAARLAQDAGLFDQLAMLLTTRRGRDAEDALRLIRRAVEGQQLTNAQVNVIVSAALRPAALTGAAATAQTFRYNPETDDFDPE